jgi:phytoene desaturase
MLDHFTQYVGSAPDASPAVLCGIAHMQINEGVWYPIGGTAAIPQALGALANDLGVEVRSATSIRTILLDANTVVGVETDTGEHIALSAVVSNADAVRTHRELLGGRPARRFERRRRYEPACSGVVLYLGLNQAYDHLLHHNFVFSQDPEDEFEAIYRQGQPAPDPTCYVCAPARTEPAVAPPGGEALYVLVHTPYLRSHHDWKTLLPVYRRTILDKLVTVAGMEDLEKRIVCEHALTPWDIHQRYRVLNGAIYGLASNGRMIQARACQWCSCRAGLRRIPWIRIVPAMRKGSVKQYTWNWCHDHSERHGHPVESSSRKRESTDGITFTLASVCTLYAALFSAELSQRAPVGLRRARLAG